MEDSSLWMLSGMAIECLLKALRVKQGHNLVADGKHVPMPGAADHDLVRLPGILELTLSDLDKDVLRRLSHFIEYGERYPVPKNAGRLQLTTSPRGGGELRQPLGQLRAISSGSTW